MFQAETPVVTDANGARGIVEAFADSQSNVPGMIGVRLENGQKLLLPQSVLVVKEDGSYYLPFALNEFVCASDASVPPLPTVKYGEITAVNAVLPITNANDNVLNGTVEVHSAEDQVGEDLNEIVVPVAAERLVIGKRLVETGRVRITKTVTEREEVVEVPLISDHVEVERIPVNRVLEKAPEVRREGELLIVPILEEVLVVEKRLMLREELHIRMRRDEASQPQQILLRREEVEIEHLKPDTFQMAASTPPVARVNPDGDAPDE